MKKENIITVLDIGTSKVCCLMGTSTKDDIADVLGFGVCHHDCLSKGVVVDIKGLSEAINRAVYAAEEISGKKAQSAFLNIAGTHIKGIVSHGEIVISDRDNEITRHDVDRVIANAKSINMPYERDIIYVVKRGFSVDGEKGIVNPAGMFGLKLETDLFLVTAKISIIDNLKKAVRQAGIGIEDYVISGVATSQSVLSQHEKDLGVIFIDMGSDLTEILVFLEGKLAHIASLPVGGDNITKAVAEKLCIPEGVAERIKIENGSLDEQVKDEKIAVKIESHKKTISRKELRDILYEEYEDILKLIKKELVDSKCAQDASSGIVMCGQTAMMDGCLESAELKLNFPVKMGHVMGLGSSPRPLPSHIYATSIGLLRYGIEAKRSKISLLSIGPKNLALALADRVRSLYHDYF
jgi:cell division protein FtsA